MPSPSHPAYDGGTVPPRSVVADFPPILAGHGRRGPRLRRALRPRRRLLAVGLALSAVGATAAAVAPSPGGARSAPAVRDVRPSAGEEKVSAPVRLSDAAAVALLRQGDRVDVIATGTQAEAARVVARCAPVERVPPGTAAAGHARRGGLVVLRLSRESATELAGAAAVSPVTVALC